MLADAGQLTNTKVGQRKTRILCVMMIPAFQVLAAALGFGQPDIPGLKGVKAVRQ